MILMKMKKISEGFLSCDETGAINDPSRHLRKIL